MNPPAQLKRITTVIAATPAILRIEITPIPWRLAT
jgi:hypothetical protein